MVKRRSGANFRKERKDYRMWTNIKMVQFALGRGGAQPSLDTIKGLLMDFIWTEYSVSQFGGTYPPIGPFFVEYMNSDTGFGPFALWIKPDSGPFHHLCKQFAVIWPSLGLMDFLFLSCFHIGSTTARTLLYPSLPLITRPDQPC